MSPGPPAPSGAVTWVKEKLALYGLEAADDAWDETIPGLGRVRLHNLVTVIPGATPTRSSSSLTATTPASAPAPTTTRPARPR